MEIKEELTDCPEYMEDLPSAPGTLDVVHGVPAETGIRLSWSPPTDCSGPSVTGYQIEVSTGFGPWTTLVPNTGSTATSHSSTGLLPGLPYWYRVSAINSIGTGPHGNSPNRTTEYERELLGAMTDALSSGKAVTAGPHPVLRSDYPATDDGEREFRNVRSMKSAMFRSHFDHLVKIGALPVGKIRIEWNPETGVAQIKIDKG